MVNIEVKVSTPKNFPLSIEKKSVFSILHHPLDPFIQLRPLCQRAAAHNSPIVCFDIVQPKPLTLSVPSKPPTSSSKTRTRRRKKRRRRRRRRRRNTCWISSLLIQFALSLLLANTRRLAPINRCFLLQPG